MKLPLHHRAFHFHTFRSIPLFLGLAALAMEPILFAQTQGRRQAEPNRDRPDIRQYFNSANSTTKGPIRFTHPPMRTEEIGSIVPMGLMVTAHVTPSDHIYFFPKDMNAGRYACDVFAPADGFITLIQHRTSLEGSTETQRDYDDYRVIIEHTGTFWSYYDLITRLAPEIDREARARLGERGGFRGRIPVKGGQVIGKVGARSLDMGVVNAESKLKFIVPEHYHREPWKIHTVDPFDYFDEPIKGQLLALNVRKAPPFGGKIDFDEDGKLVGNWFLEGSNGYAGAADPRGYWVGHLAFVYHHVEPTRILISIGDYEGRPRQFWVKGNAPDPGEVSATDGPVKYELVSSAMGNADAGNRSIRAAPIQGVVLAQVLPKRKLKFEVFPNRNSTAVNGFTDAARTYER